MKAWHANLQDAAKAELKGKFTVVSACLKRQISASLVIRQIQIKCNELSPHTQNGYHKQEKR